MENNKIVEKIQKLEESLYKGAQEIQELRRQLSPEEVKDYIFDTADGSSQKLSDLFGDKSDLIIIHNMGKQCPYCTLWADGFNGLTHHFEDRAGFVVVSHDPPDVQKQFAESRNWTFRMASDPMNEFTFDMGYLNEEKTHYMPGYSTFVKKDNGKIYRIGTSFLGPNDLYCSIWPMFGLLDGGVGDWQPKFGYGE